MPTDAFPLDSPMLPPLVLRPPHGPRILRGLVLALAFIFHVVTAGWSLICNGPEGNIAGAARVLLHDHRWLPIATLGGDSTGAPLAIWLSKLSMSRLGVSEFAARLPTALAVVAIVWFTIRLAEQFGGIRRGFTAGMILLCSPGMFTMARTLTHAPLETACVTAALYCLACGSSQRPGRRQWYFLAWIAIVLSYFAGGWRAAAVPLGTVLVLSAFFREGRIRFSTLLFWEGLLVVALGASGVYSVAAFSAGPAALNFGWAAPLGLISNATVWKSAGWMLGMLFPWSVLLIPAAKAVLTRLVALLPLEWAEAFPVAWMAVGTGLALASPAGHAFDVILIWPAFAIWGALRLETLPRKSWLCAEGIVLGLAVIGLVLTSRLRDVLALVCPSRADAIRGIPEFFWPSVTSVAFIAVLAFALFGATAFWLEWQHRRGFAMLALFGAMIPAGYAFADASSKFAPYFSYADLAHCINASRGVRPRVVIDGSKLDTSSLQFYLNEPLQPIQTIDAGSNPSLLDAGLTEQDHVYLITQRVRFHLWREMLGGRFRIACESGGNVLLTNSTEITPP